MMSDVHRNVTRSVVQTWLDRFHNCRVRFGDWIAFLTIRLYGIEATLQDVKNKKYKVEPLVRPDLSEDTTIEKVLRVAQDIHEQERSSRNVTTEKCKTLLTLSSLLVAVVGAFLPKYLSFQASWMHWMAVIAIGLLFNTIVLLLIFFDVGTSSVVALRETDGILGEKALMKQLIERHLSCAEHESARNRYLVDLFRATRFCFLSSLSIVAVLAFVGLLGQSPTSQVQQIITELRSDQGLIELLRGPRGSVGPQGDTGPRGVEGTRGEKGDRGAEGRAADSTEVVTKVISDSRLSDAIKKEVESQVLKRDSAEIRPPN